MLYSPKIFFLISSSLYDIKLSKTSFNSILPIVEGPNFPPLFPLFSFFICKPCIACDTNGHRQDASHVTTRLAFEKTTISSVLFFSSNYLGTSLTLQTFHHLLHSGQTSDNVDPECSIQDDIQDFAFKLPLLTFCISGYIQISPFGYLIFIHQRYLI